MNKINWRIRFKNKVFLVSLWSLLVVLANQIAGIFSMDITIITTELTGVLETVLMILSLAGIIVDPTTSSLKDSPLAMSYDEPYDENKEEE